MTRPWWARMGVLLACAALAFAIHSAMLHAQPAPKLIPQETWALHLQVPKQTAVVFKTSSKAVADRVALALKGSAGNYRLDGVGKTKYAVNRGSLTLKDVALIQKAAANEIGPGNWGAAEQDTACVVTQVLSANSTNDNGAYNNQGGINGNNANNVLNDTQGATATNGGSSGWTQLQNALKGVDQKLYSMDIVDAQDLAQSKVVQLGVITGRGVFLSRRLAATKQ